jgi:hypothetical protein
MIVYISKSFIQEKKYILKVLLNNFLGLTYDVCISDEGSDTTILLESGKQLIILDSFFSKFCDDLTYLNVANIPDEIVWVQNQFVCEQDMPIIYGNNELNITENEIFCGADLFSSAFFMLTRWEEYVCEVVDLHGRFKAENSLAYKQNFLMRPVVNEYIEMLWKMLCYLGIKQKRKQREYALVLTHDIDSIRKYNNGWDYLRRFASLCLKHKKFSEAIHLAWTYIKIKKGLIKDPYDNLAWISTQSASKQLVSRFYFMVGGRSHYDNKYDLNSIKNDVLALKKKGHVVGLHPSYDTFRDEAFLVAEKKRLERIVSAPVFEGRQHYLRFQVPNTWSAWDSAGLTLDSTCGYPELSGFRCGTGDVFSVFNILERKMLNLKERPLIWMDDTYRSYQSFSEETIRSTYLKFQNICRKYHMSYTVLVHNSFVQYFNMWDIFHYK